MRRLELRSTEAGGRTLYLRTKSGAVHVGLRNLINVYFRVQLIIMSINIVVCSTAFLMIGNPYAILLGVLTGIIDALPIFGTGTVLIPWAVGSLLSDM